MAKNILTKAWRIHGSGGQLRTHLRFEEFQFKKSSSDVVVRMQCAPVTIQDIDQVRGLYGPIQVPALAGNTGSGVIAEGAGSLQEGDHVVLVGASGAWSQYVAANPSQLLRVPATLPLEYASLLTGGPIMAYQMLKSSGLKAGDAVIVSGAESPIGMAVLQLAKIWGLHAVGVAFGAPPMKVEKLKQLGLTVLPHYALDAAGLFGAARPKLAISLRGGRQSSYLAELLANNGHIMACTPASDEPQIIPSAAFANKHLLFETFIARHALEGATAAEKDAMVDELTHLITSHHLKANAIIRHEFTNLFAAIEEAERGDHNVVLMHEGTEKTWANASHDAYMAIDEKLQANWDAAAAVQDPFLKMGRDQPWDILAEAEDLALPAELKVKFAGVTSEQELLAVLEGLNFRDRLLLRLPGTEAVTVTPKELKQLVADFAK